MTVEKGRFEPQKPCNTGSAVVEVRKAIERSAATTIVEWARGERPSNALNSV